MLYINKKPDAPTAFLEAIGNLEKYEDLKDAAKESVVTLLLQEQGDMCALCERKKAKFTPTIEHFLPKSIFPHLQLAYHNLYVSCNKCNEPKGNYLIPAYIFDSRFAPTAQTTKEYPKPAYYYKDGKCYIHVEQAQNTNSKSILPLHYHAYLLQNTLDLLCLNRSNPDSRNSENTSLLDMRAEVWKMIRSYLASLDDNKLKEKYTNLLSKIREGNCPEFVSLHVYLYQLALKKRNITV